MMKTIIPDYQEQKTCFIRWEITHKCDLGCRHCFIDRDTSRPDLAYTDCLKILGSFRSFLRENNLAGKILFTGGDPLLRKDFMDILQAAGEYQNAGVPIKQIAIHGNPTHLTEKIARRLKDYGVAIYVMSLEGSEPLHDFYRKPGSFRQTLRAIKLLIDAAIRPAIRLTVSRQNAPELAGIIRTIINAGAETMNIGMLLPAGRGENLKDNVLSAGEYRRCLLEILKVLDSLDEKHLNLKLSLICGEPLFGRLFYELGRWDEYLQFYAPKLTVGPLIAGTVFVILPDGTVYPRTLIPINIGRMPRDSFQEIYDSSELLRSLEREPMIERRKNEFPKCRNCPAVNYCIEVGPGYVTSENAYGPDPGCWVE